MIFFLIYFQSNNSLREMAKVLIANDRQVHMARRAILDNHSSSDEDTDETSDENESESVYGHSDNETDPVESQYSLHEHDDQIDFVVMEDLDEDEVGPVENLQGDNVQGDDLQDDHVQDQIIQEEAIVNRRRRYRFRRRRLLEVLDETETYEDEFKEVFRMSWVTFREVIFCINGKFLTSHSFNGHINVLFKKLTGSLLAPIFK